MTTNQRVEPLRGTHLRPSTTEWLVTAAGAAIGLGLLLAGIVIAATMSADGDPRREALANTLTTAGATVASAVVALAVVLVALRLESSHRIERDYQEYQVDLVREAADWLCSTSGALFAIWSVLVERADARDPQRKDELARAATRLAQEFYDTGQDLGSTDRLAELIDDTHIRDALREGDSQLRIWNETVAGDHATREVRLFDEEGAVASQLLETAGRLSELKLDVEQRYVRTVRALRSRH